MVIGIAKEMNEDEDAEYLREQSYQYDLDMFEGVPYHFHGLNDELDNLVKLIDILGESVINQEKEFKEIYSEEYDPENSFLSDKIINNWYKKAYRSFSYKAMLIIIHGIFEKGLFDLYYLLREHKRITFIIKNDNLIDVLKQYKLLDISIISD